MKRRILVVDDEKSKRIALEIELKEDGFDVVTCGNAYKGLSMVRKNIFDVVITDLKMPGMDGLSFLKEIKSLSKDTEVFLITAFGTVENAVEAMKQGVADYITKPFSYEELHIKLKKCLDLRSAREEIRELKQQLSQPYQYHELIGKSAAMREIYKRIELIADTPHSVLIQGETGTGKELAANAVHFASSRRDKPFIKTSCAALNKEILESELFGHEAGAFTGAVRQKRGRFELADGGTFFLDDVDDIPLDLQVKLLRILQEREFERTGGTKTIKVDVRLITATKKDLRKMVEAGQFREDLFYRLNVVLILLPPLRERKEDILFLAEHFMKKHGRGEPASCDGLPPEVLRIFQEYAWPGNVRELENVIEQCLALTTTAKIDVDSLPPHLTHARTIDQISHMDLESCEQVNLPKILRHAERALIQWAMKKADGNQVKAAELLQIARSTLRSKLDQSTRGESDENAACHGEISPVL